MKYYNESRKIEIILSLNRLPSIAEVSKIF